MDNPELIAWLLEGPPWVQYQTRREMLGQPADYPKVQAAQQAMLAHPQVQEILARLADWPRPLLSNHKSANIAIHRLSFLADLGISASDPGMEAILHKVLAHQSEQGPFQLLTNIPQHYGGSGEDVFAWALCDAPVTLYSLIQLGLGGDPRVQQAITHLVGLARDNGWPCAVSPELGRWHGPGKKSDPCPYANLVMLKALALLPEAWSSPAVHNGCETALRLWENSLEQHPYMFYMGKDFRKLKAPLIWYDLLHVLDVLTHFPWLRNDPRLLEMASILRSKADLQGRFTPESVYQAYAGWDFGQKKAPSRWLTFLAWRVLTRLSPGPISK